MACPKMIQSLPERSGSQGFTRLSAWVPRMTQGMIGTRARYAITHAPFFIDAPRHTDAIPRTTPPSGKMPTTRPDAARAMAVRIACTGTPNRSTGNASSASTRRGGEAVAVKLEPRHPVDLAAEHDTQAGRVQVAQMAAGQYVAAFPLRKLPADDPDIHGAEENKPTYKLGQPVVEPPEERGNSMPQAGVVAVSPPLP